MIHRDIKPSNLLLDRLDQAFVADFGLALTDEEFGIGTGLAGTPLYMSPEQAQGESHQVDGRSDIFSLGIVLYELLTGVHPFNSPHATTAEVLRRIRESPARPLRQRVDLAPQLEQVCLTALAKLPEDRYTTAGDLADDLASVGKSLDPSRKRRRQVIAGGSVVTIGVVFILLAMTAWTSRSSNSYDGAPNPTDQSTSTGSEARRTEQSPTSEAHASIAVDPILDRLRDASASDEEVWRHFVARPDPTLRTKLIHELAEATVDAQRIVDRLVLVREPSARAALLLALGEYDEHALSTARQKKLLPQLLDWYRNDPHPSVHSAIDWLARRWGFGESLEALKGELQMKLIPFEGGWYETMEGQTMVVLPGPSTFVMGSPVDEPRREVTPSRDETQAEVEIPRTFAISTKEVTAFQIWRATKGANAVNPPEDLDQPGHDVEWDDAADYCNRLSALEGIPSTEYCYEEVVGRDQTTTYREKPDALNLIGYRLPTEAEWEYACRAGTVTCRPFGSDAAMLPRYVHCGMQSDPSPQAVGLLKPNDFGLFDTLGNVSEWVHDSVNASDGRLFRYLRGGSAWTEPLGVRSSARYLLPQRYTTPRMGFRVARTLRQRKLSNRLHVDLLAGPPISKEVVAETQGDEFDEVCYYQVICLGTWDRGDVVARRFRLHNRSETEVSVEVARANDILVVTRQPPTTIPPGGVGEFHVTLNDFGVGPRGQRFDVTIRTATDQLSFKLRMSGSINGTPLNIFDVGRTGDIPQVFDFGTVLLGTTIRHQFSLLNEGNRTSTARIIDIGGGFRITENVEPPNQPQGTFAYFTLEVDTQSAGTKSGTVTMRTSDPLARLYKFAVSAEVLEP